MIMLRFLAVFVLFSATTIEPASAMMIQRPEALLLFLRPSPRGTMNDAKPVSLSIFQQNFGFWSVSSNPSIHAAARSDATNDMGKMEAPEYNREAKASEFFSNKFFFDGDETFAASPILAKRREEKFGNKTVETVLNQIAVEADFSRFFAGTIMSGTDLVLSYWKQTKVTIEKRLNGRTLNLLGGSGIELALINERYVDLSISVAKLSARENDVCVVLGPSGSGKTFFAAKVAAAFHPSLTKMVNLRYSMTIYFKASEYIDKLRDDPQSLVQLIRRRIEDQLGKGCFGIETDVSRYQKLDMHVSVVIDEAGSETDGYFEEILNLYRIYEYLKLNLAKSVRLIVAGTRLTAENLNSEPGVRKYRMQAWSKRDVKKVAEKRFSDLPDYVLDFALTRPMMNALTTNARTAWFLLLELEKYAIYRKYEKGHMHQKELVHVLENNVVAVESTVIPQVVAQYIGESGLQKLSSDQRLRVAAMVFSILEKSARDSNPMLPTFASYTDDHTEIAMANALINVNVEYNKGVLQYVDEKKKSISVPPAITIVLFQLLGVDTGVLSRSKRLKVMTALHAFRKLVIRSFSENKDITERLQKVRLVFLQARIPETNAQTTIQTPMLNPYTVWINGDSAPFADVVAPHFLFLCKHIEQDTSQVKCNLYLELRKCGLLVDDASSRGKIGRVTLNGIIKQWNENAIDPQEKNLEEESELYEVLKRADGDDNENDNEIDMHKECLIYYPEIEIETVSAPKDAGIDFAEYDVDTIDKELSQTQDVSRELNFVIVTNAKEIVFSFKNEIENSRNRESKTKSVIKNPEALSKLTKWELRVTNNDIDNNGILKTDDSISKLNEIKKMIRVNVTLRFYLGG